MAGRWFRLPLALEREDENAAGDHRDAGERQRRAGSIALSERRAESAQLPCRRGRYPVGHLSMAERQPFVVESWPLSTASDARCGIP